MATAALPVLPPNAWWPRRLWLASRALLVLKDDPGHTYYGPLVNTCLDRETYEAIAQEWRTDPSSAALLDERPSLQGPDLDLSALSALPDHTFGFAFAKYFSELGIQPFVSTFPLHTDADYLSKRYRETHDILHVLTGYPTDDYSEMELQAFVYGNQGLRQGLFIACTGVLALLPQIGPLGMRRYLRDMRAAYQRGQASEDLLRARFEEHFEEPLSEVRARFVAPQPHRLPSPLAHTLQASA